MLSCPDAARLLAEEVTALQYPVEHASSNVICAITLQSRPNPLHCQPNMQNLPNQADESDPSEIAGSLLSTLTHLTRIVLNRDSLRAISNYGVEIAISTEQNACLY